MNISIIGTGIYGIALALSIKNVNNKIKMWSENDRLVENFKKNHDLKPITDVKIPENISVTNSLAESLTNADLIILVPSAKYIRTLCMDMKKHYNTLTPICIASKGLENNTCSFLSDIVKTELKAKHIAVISGPTFAIDLINNEPCALTLSTTSKKAINTIKEAFSFNNRLKMRVNYDMYGTELCGSIKNVIAIAAGILDGLGYKESTRAFLITEAIHDIKELLDKMECNPKTILSFAGIGDLILTCSSPKSRNYNLGFLIGKKDDKEKIEEYLKENTVEGYYTLLSIKDLTKNRKIKMPIINIIYEIVVNNKNPELLSEFLINKN